MIINKLAEVIYKFYNNGRPSSTNKTFSQADILQYVKMGYGNMMRQLAFNSLKTFEWQESYFYSDILSEQKFPLGEPGTNGRRRVDMSGFDIYRLPKSVHITNVTPAGNNCGPQELGQITQVSPGEENFYIGPDFNSFLFFVIKGKGIDTYHIPPCVNDLNIEATYATDDIEVPEDIAYDIANQILSTVLRIPGFAGKDVDNSFSPPKSNQLRRSINPQETQTEI